MLAEKNISDPPSTPDADEGDRVSGAIHLPAIVRRRPCKRAYLLVRLRTFLLISIRF